jgi:hypothetical protein
MRATQLPSTGSPGEVVIQIADDDLTAFWDGSFHVALVC